MAEMDVALRDAVLAALSVRRPPPSEQATREAGILYAEDFDAPEILPKPPPPPPPPPSYDQAELEAACERAREEGRLAALQDEEQVQAGLRLAALQAIADALSASHDHAARLAEEAAEALARTVLGLLLAALPATCARHGERELRALVRTVLPALSAEPRITVRANPAMQAALAAELARMEPDLAARVALVPTEALAPGDASIAWTDGSAVRDAAAIATAARDALAPLDLLDLSELDAREMAHAG